MDGMTGIDQHSLLRRVNILVRVIERALCPRYIKTLSGYEAVKKITAWTVIRTYCKYTGISCFPP